ncbi:hypothetical protein [Falsirhodobacter sp. 20TX0035]|uniref:hypothetical protein n=1 Tax=Falsirhodobacter sp. 20TX0035 TaxID=3022019 RepID=UPI00232C10E1|nr:hypothetical protein [Falsirhodobacter sp. 20TX0035]MDB6454428.1 hypothetical protein [Falsirhodobacter sp. 20TX0035]
MIRILAFFLFLFPVSAFAEAQSCTTSVEGQQINLFYEPDDEQVGANQSRREAWLGGWGKLDCPSYVTLRYLTPDLTDDQRQTFCLQWDNAANTYAGYAEGARDAYLRCRAPRRTFCERVNTSVQTSMAVAGLADAPEGSEGVVNGVQTVTRPGGAVVLSGAGAAVQQTIAGASTTAGAALATPIGLAAAAVSVVAVGGAVYLCSE